MTIGEGAGILVLEDFDRARRRGARIYAELAGHGATCEAYHPTSPEPDGNAVAAIVSPALRDARLVADAVDHINAHGTATPQNDRGGSAGFTGCSAIARAGAGDVGQVDGRPLSRRRRRDRSCSAGLSVARGVIPPTIHHSETDEDDVSTSSPTQRANASALRGLDLARLRRQRRRDRAARRLTVAAARHPHRVSSSSAMFDRVLILSASAGAGHVRAADALQKAFTEAGAAREVRHVDALQYTNSVPPPLLQVYLDMVNTMPEVLGWLYDHLDTPGKDERRQARVRQAQHPRRSSSCSTEYQPDVHGLHPLPAGRDHLVAERRRAAR